MIVSHKHKFIFIKTHKTAGTSLQIALSKHCGQDDIISRLHADDVEVLNTNNGKGEQNVIVPKGKYNFRDWFQYLIRGREQIFTEHNAISYLKRWLPKEVWDSYYKFGFERHPYDKVLSYYYWRTRNSSITLDSFLQESLDTLSDFEMYSEDGAVQIDKVYNFEMMSDAITDLESRFGIHLDMQNIRAKSTHRPKSSKPKIEFSRTQKQMIQDAFSREFQHFYSLESI